MHQKPTIRQSWAPLGKDGWYIDRSNDYYRCYDIYVPETRAIIQPGTVNFFPHNSKIPFTSSTENTTITATELIHALCNPAPAAPYAHIGDAQVQALEQLIHFPTTKVGSHNGSTTTKCLTSKGGPIFSKGDSTTHSGGTNSTTHQGGTTRT